MLPSSMKVNSCYYVTVLVKQSLAFPDFTYICHTQEINVIPSR